MIGNLSSLILCQYYYKIKQCNHRYFEQLNHWIQWKQKTLPSKTSCLVRSSGVPCFWNISPSSFWKLLHPTHLQKPLISISSVAPSQSMTILAVVPSIGIVSDMAIFAFAMVTIMLLDQTYSWVLPAMSVIFFCLYPIAGCSKHLNSYFRILGLSLGLSTSCHRRESLIWPTSRFSELCWI